MKRGLKTSAYGVASALFLSLVLSERAAPRNLGAALSLAAHDAAGDGSGFASSPVAGDGFQTGTGREMRALPSPVGFRESEGRGLLVKVWVNGAGPFTFALDTGAGASILSPRVAGAARVEVEAGGGRGIEIGGLSGASVAGGRKAFARSIAAGFRGNLLPVGGLVIVAPGLPGEVDGILDPTELLSPLGYVIDMPRGELRVFDPRSTPLRAGDTPPGGAVVRWLSDGSSRRPFVMLAEGRRALLDTGSGFGLAVNETAARSLGIIAEGGRERGATRDLAGGSIASRRVRPSTVSLGPLVLRGVPTDLLLRTEKGAPVLLGRDALRPFQLTFDPINRLIMLRP
ncbi:MAG: aspartyl protease family protein [Acidobacteria bacterium]|nr:aspartyl protease family protein [Acidobacteriota bacterium]